MAPAQCSVPAGHEAPAGTASEDLVPAAASPEDVAASCADGSLVAADCGGRGGTSACPETASSPPERVGGVRSCA
ncbi:MAG: hypothetical protein IT373_04255 [Polyangiaceae bacterium]|nr:hypothetical protein [Polyangiaceae bacterium]